MMVEAWWLYVAGVTGMVLGMLVFAVMTMAADEPQQEIRAPQAPDALT
jgi:hypothetical protein